MELKIIIELKVNYGTQSIYPICDKAKTFAKMLGQKTLTKQNIDHIIELGYKIEIKHPEYKF